MKSAEHAVLDELGSVLFASLPRSDQRRNGTDYVRGLLDTVGRKSIRNIATHVGRPGVEQALHHFISNSTWDWGPLRLTLARYLAGIAQPRAWVVRPATIPKAGEQSVGVGRHFDPDLGQALNAQRAASVWLASEELAGPVDWRIQLTRDWLDNSERREKAAIPIGLAPESIEDCMVEAFLAAAARGDLPRLPVVLDAQGFRTHAVVDRLRRSGSPFVVRINSTYRLSMADWTITRGATGPLTAHQIMSAAHQLRRPVPVATAPDGGVRIDLVAAVPVHQASSRGADAGSSRWTLLGTGPAARPWPDQLWLTNVGDISTLELVHLTTLLQRVNNDFTTVTKEVGIHDFAGRSYTGWNRHATLVSAAHVVAALIRSAGDPQSRHPQLVTVPEASTSVSSGERRIV